MPASSITACYSLNCKLTMGNLLTIHFWFDMRPGALTPRLQLYFIIFVGILFFGTVFFGIIKNRSKSIFTKIFSSLYNFSLTNLIIGLFLLFFTYEMLPFLSMRLWFLIWLLSMLGWAGYVIYKISLIPKIKEEKQKLHEFNKYIP